MAQDGAPLVHVSLDDLSRLRHKARGFSFLPRQPVHSLLTGRHGSRLRGRGLDFLELRHYYEGDDTRTIDWRATARQGSPQVRVYTEERDRSVLLVVDQRMSMFFGSRHATKSAVAAQVAALAAWRVTSLGDRVGAIVFADDGLDQIRPQGRDQAVMRVLEAVVRQNNRLSASSDRPADTGMFNEALRRAVRLVSHDWLVCLITDAAGADPETVELVTKLTAHNDVLTIFIFDPLEADLPDIGRVVVADAGQRLEIDTSRRSTRRRFAEEFATRRARVEEFSRKRTIPVLPISTDSDVTDQLRRILGEAQRPSRRGHSTLIGAGPR
jgi:uncharacterized protein (DUF58 family)